MIIKGVDYEITPVSNESLLWDLRLMKTVKPRGGEAREELGDPTYGIPLDSAIKHIVSYRTKKKFENEETVKLVDYIKVLQMMDDEIRKEVRESKKSKDKN